MTLTRRQITELLDSRDLRPSRALGQNFVADPNTVRRIARLARVGRGDHVVEIGAGLGSLTLALAETGAIGLFLWSSVIYVSVKVPVAGYLRFRNDPDATIARQWGLAIAASLAGMLAGIFFLSFSYHIVLWIFIGLTGGYYHAVTAHDPSWRVRFGPIDAIAVLVFDVALIAAIYGYLQLHPPG